MFNLWLEFLICAVLIIISGTYLSRYGDVIAEKTGIGQALIGMILVALATSLPELVTSITSSLVNAPNIAVGNVFGSNTFNLMILAVTDLIHGPGPLMYRVRYSHILSGLLGIVLSGIVVFSIIVYQYTVFEFGILGIGLDSLILIFAYLFGIRLVFRYEKKNPLDQEEEKFEEKVIGKVSFKKAALGFAVSAAVIVVAGTRLTITGDTIAQLTGIDQSFIGTIMVAAATSLPELVASISAVRIGAYNMAVGNVMGSNIFNMIIVFFADLFYRSGYILGSVDVVHVVTAMVGLMMSAIVLIGLFYRSQKTILTVGWDSLFITLIYLVGVYLLFHIGVVF